MQTAKLFTNGKNQAIRIPKAFEYQGIDEVAIHKEGNKLIIEPVRKSWSSMADLPAGDDDFMPNRPDLFDDREINF